MANQTRPSYQTLDDFTRTILDRLAKDAPALTDFEPDASGNYAAAIMRASAKGVSVLRVPSKSYIVGDCLITKPLLLIGDGLEGINPVGATFIKPASASYCLSFDSTGTTRPTGGGLHKLQVRGNDVADTGTLVNVKTWSYFRAEYCGFNNLAGSAFTLRDVAESKINDNLFRRIGASNGQVILLGDYVGTNVSNVNNLQVRGNTFGLCSGSWLRASNIANVDMLWFQFNKVEWDATPTGANTESQYVLDLGQVSRAWITQNGFTHFRPDAGHNLYAGVLRMGSASAQTVFFNDNLVFGCQGNLFDVQGGSLVAKDNYSNQANASGQVSYSVTSNKWCHIEEPIRFSSNGNLSASIIDRLSNFIPSHKLGGTINLSYVAETETSYKTVLSVPAGTECRRVTLPEELTTGNDGVRVTARVKSVGGAGSVTLNTNGTLDISSVALVADVWTNAVFTIPSNQLGAGGVRVNNTGGTTVLFDGLRVARADFMDISFAWVPGSIAAGAQVDSPVQSYVGDFINPGNTIRGFGVPTFDVPPGDVAVNVRITNSTGGFVVSLRNHTASAITPGITRCIVRILL